MPTRQHYPFKNYKDNAQHHNESHGHDLGRIHKYEDGQKYSDSYYNPGEASGMKTNISTSGRVGMQSGGEQAMNVSKPTRNSMVSTESKALKEASSGDDK